MTHIEALAHQLTEALKGRNADYIEAHLEESQSSHITYRGRELESIGTTTAIGGNVQPRRYRQPGEKDGDSMTSFVMESFANVDGREFQEQQYTARSWRRLL